ncbi:hypothetical protein FACS1894195_0530 [Bacteroidia bacterium]|nr:hypothetical protein FACS1894195_0530 [Bacteroidia bacterium]
MSLINISICLSDLPKDKIKEAANGKLYMDIVCTSRKEVDKYGHTHTVYVSQTKEEREAKSAIVYVGNGREYEPKQASTPKSVLSFESVDALPSVQDRDDLPF